MGKPGKNTEGLPLERRLLSRSYETSMDAISEALRSGAAGDEALAAALPQGTKDGRAFIAAALGDTRGAAGDRALREAFLFPDGSRDLKCAVLVALAKRHGADASADFENGLRSSDGVVKSYAAICFAGAGDDRAWDAIFDRLRTHIRNPTRRASMEPSEVTFALAYLSRHLERAGSDRCLRLVTIIRDQWENLSQKERAWLELHWEDSRPGGPEPRSVHPPEAEIIRKAIRGPLLDAPAY